MQPKSIAQFIYKTTSLEENILSRLVLLLKFHIENILSSTCTLPILEVYSTYVETMQDMPQLKNSKQKKIDLVKHEKFARFESESAKINNETRGIRILFNTWIRICFYLVLMY